MSGVLDGISSLVEEYMYDSVRIFRVTGRVLNQVTLKYDNIETDLYVGKAFVGSNATPATQTVGSEPVARTQYEIGIPLAVDGVPTAEIQPEDYVQVLTSLYDSQLVDQVLKVIGPSVSTFSVHRRIQARLDDSRHAV